jgi:hypothetical protein
MRRSATKRITAFGGIVLASVLIATAAWAGTTVDSGDVGIVGAAAASPAGATLIRGGSTTFDLTLTMDDGNLPSSQCDDVGVTAPTTFTVGTSSLSTSGTETKDFTCPWQVGGSTPQGPQSLTFSGRTLEASGTAPLGRSNYDITFGTGNMVTAESQIALAVTPAPKVYVTVNPRPASVLIATAGNGQIQLDWTASPDASEITDYKIEVTDGKSDTLTATKGAVTLTDTGLTNGTEYCYRIRAHYNDGSNDFFSDWEPASDTVCATPVAPAATYFASFRQPIDPGSNVINTAKLGRVIPVKLEVLSNTAPEEKAGPVSIQRLKVACDSTDSGDPVEVYAAGSSNTGNQFRWDTAGDFWIYNLDTSALGGTAGTCYRLDEYLGGTTASNGYVTGGVLIGSFQIKLTK